MTSIFIRKDQAGPAPVSHAWACMAEVKWRKLNLDRVMIENAKIQLEIDQPAKEQTVDMFLLLQFLLLCKCLQGMGEADPYSETSSL